MKKTTSELVSMMMDTKNLSSALWASHQLTLLGWTEKGIQDLRKQARKNNQ